jgi:hypothetical protein
MIPIKHATLSATKMQQNRLSFDGNCCVFVAQKTYKRLNINKIDGFFCCTEKYTAGVINGQ